MKLPALSRQVVALTTPCSRPVVAAHSRAWPNTLSCGAYCAHLLHIETFARQRPFVRRAAATYIRRSNVATAAAAAAAAATEQCDEAVCLSVCRSVQYVVTDCCVPCCWLQRIGLAVCCRHRPTDRLIDWNAWSVARRDARTHETCNFWRLLAAKYNHQAAWPRYSVPLPCSDYWFGVFLVGERLLMQYQARCENRENEIVYGNGLAVAMCLIRNDTIIACLLSVCLQTVMI